MLSLFLAYSLALKTCAATPANEDGTQPSCVDTTNSRTLLNIIWSCITTIFLCTWVAIHPNIPEPINTSGMSILRRAHVYMHCLFSNRLPVFICALLVPEYILAWAIRQYLVARELGKRNKFTTTHGFFIIMGGFHYFPESSRRAKSSRTDGGNKSGISLFWRSNGINASRNVGPLRAHPLDYEEVISMINTGKILLPTKAEIEDKSKSDWIAKSLVLLQTTWFIVQCIARRIEHLPTTELEIVTLAYTAVNFGIFIAWWDKPQLVDCPVRVFHPPARTRSRGKMPWFRMIYWFIIGDQDGFIDLHQEPMVPRFYGGDVRDRHFILAGGITLLFGVVFGAIHCIAWSFEFPSHTETLLWRMSSAGITCVPVLIFLTAIAWMWANIHDFWLLAYLFLTCFPLSGVLYIAVRLTTLILAFMNLSSAPPGVFQAVHWTNLIPHL